MDPFENLAAAAQRIDASYKEYLSSPSAGFVLTDRFFAPSGNIIACGDNLEFIKWLSDGEHNAPAPDFIYIDPPFFTGTDQLARLRLATGENDPLLLSKRAYSDKSSSGIGPYLSHLGLRLAAMRDVMADTGVIAVHLDWHAVHYVKLLMDGIFGSGRMVNELIWSYRSGGFGSKGFAKKHDTILVYSKSKDYYFKPQKEKSYNRGFKPYRFKGVKEYEDENGWYTLVNHRDVINLDMVPRSSPERTGYATQKPLKLAELLLESFAPAGGFCCDFYAGSGTLAEAACRKGNAFACCDVSPAAFATAAKRLAGAGASFELMTQNGLSFEAAPSISFEMADRQIFMDGSALYSLAGCHKDVEKLGLKGKALASLKKALDSNPLAMAEFAAAGRIEEGCFTARKVFLPASKGRELTVSAAPSDTHIKVWDKFGGSALQKISL